MTQDKTKLVLEEFKSGSTSKKATYTAYHITPGAEGTTLKIPVTLDIGSEFCDARINFEECRASTPEEALDRMANWLERISIAIKNRDKSKTITI